jgi:UDP-N-acetylglucosamine--N-acetylmuramyl-(pentapeptide) pyrophosphoryl-undecaprenol N-acetylglucosamine transferase
MSMIQRVIVAGGGTGGHLFPGIAVVEELRRRNPKLSVLFVGTERGIESRVLPARGERVELIDVKPLMGKKPMELARSAFGLPRAAVQALSILRRERPQLVIGLGGYAAGPMLLTAAARGIPTALLEQNVHVGLTNRMLSRTVGRAYLTFEQTAPLFGPSRARVLGNPVRRAFVDAARIAASDPVGRDARGRVVLVLGGSQGAESLNRFVPEALAKAGLGTTGIEVVHQSGAAMQQAVQQRYAELGIQARVVPFIDDMARAYVDSALVIARAGATTLAELCTIGRASLLVPYPFAAQDHQLKNARALEEANAARVVLDAELGSERLADSVRELLADAGGRRSLSEAARRLGRPDAAAAIVDDLSSWLGAVGGGDVLPEGDGSEPAGGEPEVSAGPYENRAAVVRRPKVKRCELRIRTVPASIDAAG